MITKRQKILEQAGIKKRENIPFTLDTEEFYGLVERVSNPVYVRHIRVEQMVSSDGMDAYELHPDNGKILIRATSGVAAASAFHYYLKEFCGYTVGPLFRTGTLPEVPPTITEVIKKRSPFHYRYLYNYCTFGYTYAFHSWEDWEPVLDWALLSGYNLILNPIAQEAVWFELLQEFGYSPKEAKDFLTGPAFMPWLLMMNMTGYSGEYPDWWFQERIDLAGKFNKRLQAFGAGILLPGYCGMVPDDFTQRFPAAKIIRQGMWCGLPRPSYLLPENELFHKFADSFYRIQGKIPGASQVHYYSADPFHEGGCSDGIDLVAFTRGVFCAMERFDPQAVWAFQGWQFNPKREMLNALDKSKTLIMNLSAETTFDGSDNFADCPWIYCTVNNFGGQHILRGNILKSLQKPYDGLDDSYTMVGIGIMPEAVETDEVFFDIIGEIAFSETKPDLLHYLISFITRRYGICTDQLIAAWELLCEKVYHGDNQIGGDESPFCARPSLTVNRVSQWGGESTIKDSSILISVIKLLLSEYDVCKSSEAYLYDLVDFTRQLLANDTWKTVYAFQKAYASSDIQEFLSLSSEFLKRFDLMEQLLKTHSRFSAGEWLERAKKLGRTPLEKRWFEWNARALITVWAPKEGDILHDYAAREYYDLIHDFYRPRWEAFISSLELSMYTCKPVREYEAYDQEILFTFGRKTCFNGNRGDVREAVLAVLSSIE